jgi:hypothetical protein
MRFKMAWRDGDVLTVDGGGCEFGLCDPDLG